METLQRTANRGSISTSSYEIDNSCKFEKNNDSTTVEFFERNVSSAGSRTTGTFSAWIKKTDVTTAQYLFTFGNVDNDNGRTFARFQADGSLRVGGGQTVWRNTDRLFRDPTGWYHVVIAFDTTQSTANDRIKIYINGVQETSFSTTNNPSEDGILGLNFGKQAIGYNTIDNNSGFNGYMAEVLIQDGTASAPTEFGEFDSNSGIWKPKDLSAISVGTNGTYLKFENAASMGAATSGNAFTVQNINQNDQATDTPTNNFCIMNMLDITNGNIKNQEGATKVTTDGGSGWCSMVATMGVTKGKWYWETQRSGGSSDSNDVVVGIVGDSDPYVPYSSAAQYYIGNVAESSSIGFYTTGSPNVRNGSGDSISNSAGDIIMVGLDMDNGKIYFGVNGTWDGLGTGGSTLWSSFDNQFVLPAASVYQGKQIKINFGGYASYTISSAQSDANGYGTFEYAVPSGYYALCSQNLALYG